MTNLFLTLICCFTLLVNGKEYHVSKQGNDNNPGSKTAPFKTISKAATIALAGDIITVHEGTYRERVNPLNGGLNDQQRITYRAAQGEVVWIKGSEVINNWKRYKGDVWKVSIANSFFGDFNPYKEILKGDWLMDTYGRDHHLGEVYLNGEALYEINTLEQVLDLTSLKRASDQEGSKYKWYCSVNDTTTEIYAHFKGQNPNKALVEINVRPTVFFPKKTGVNYITVSGFYLAHAATQWAPPTAEQEGLIGPYWSKGWIIENNYIAYSKCSGISIGKDRKSGHNEWTNLKVKHGTQRERDVIFKALQQGWNKETVGSHIIRNNEITDCEQTGICGHLGGVFSKIYNNHIYNIHIRKQFFGYEIGGIKLHAAIDVEITSNVIHDNFRGIWLDWQAQGARVSKNLLFNHPLEDLFIEVNHGPLVIDNNILLSEISLLNVSQGTAFAHNIFGGSIKMRLAPDRFTPYHFAHATAVMGLMSILHGDDRYYNNIFASNNTHGSPTIFTGTNAYNKHPLPTDYWYEGKSPKDFAAHKLPVYIGSNVYYNLSKPFNREADALVKTGYNPELKLEESIGGYTLTINLSNDFNSTPKVWVNSALLGAAFQSEAAFENPNGTPMTISTDFYNTPWINASPVAGPLASFKPGLNTLNIPVTKKLP
mgnify:FL=1